jgi:hypothetical protein
MKFHIFRDEKKDFKLICEKTSDGNSNTVEIETWIDLAREISVELYEKRKVVFDFVKKISVDTLEDTAILRCNDELIAQFFVDGEYIWESFDESNIDSLGERLSEVVNIITLGFDNHYKYFCSKEYNF